MRIDLIHFSSDIVLESPGRFCEQQASSEVTGNIAGEPKFQDTLLYFIGSWSYLCSLRTVFWPVVLVARGGCTQTRKTSCLDFLITFERTYTFRFSGRPVSEVYCCSIDPRPGSTEFIQTNPPNVPLLVLQLGVDQH